MTTDPYRRLSIQAKQARHRSKMSEPAIACPVCEVQTTVVDLARHAGACPGHRPAHPLSRWVSWSEARRLGIPRATMGRWIERGDVQVQGERRARRYLLRDLVKRMAARQSRRRGPENGTRR
jgi:hypothetical protein